MPLIVPAGVSVRPGGVEPLITDQFVKGGVPPVAASVTEYGEFTCPDGSGDVVEIVRVGGLIVN
jgi:hypothetical protein